MAGAYINNIYDVTDGSNIISAIKSAISTAGWSLGSTNTYTSPSTTTPLTVVFSTSTLTFPNARLSLTLNGQTVWLAAGISGTGTTASQIHMELSISDTLFFIKLTGPGVGGGGAGTNGSPATFAFISSYSLYNSQSSITNAQKYVIGAMYYTDPGTTTLPTPSRFVKYYDPDFSPNLQDAILVTMKNAWEGASTTGYQLPSRLFGGGEITWPYVIVSSARGVVGRINNINYVSPTYVNTSLSPAESAPGKINLLVDGMRYILTKPGGIPATATGTPLGQTVLATNQTQGVTSTSTSNTSLSPFSNVFNSCGPYIYIMKGDGS